MHQSHSIGPVTLAALVLALGACSGERVAPVVENPVDGAVPIERILSDSAINRDLAASEGEAIATDLQLLAGSQTALATSAAAAPARTAAAIARCSYEAESGRYTCAASSEQGLTVSRSIAFLDATGAAMEEFDSLLTAAVNFRLAVDGAVSRNFGRFTLATHRTLDRTVSGMSGAETQRVWSGTGTATDTVSQETPAHTKRYVGQTVDSLVGAVVAVSSESGYPLSGKATRQVTRTVTVTGASTGTKTVTRRIEVTFNGTASVPLTVGEMSCTLHLDARTVTGCSR